MYVFSPMMQSDPMWAGPRTWTSDHTEVRAPMSTPSSTSAVGWTRASDAITTRLALARSGDAGDPGDRASLLLVALHRNPAAAPERLVRGLDDVDGGDRLLRRDEELLLAAHRAAEVLHRAPHALELLVAVSEHDPVGAARLPVLRLAPADPDRAVGPVHVDEAVELLVDAPRQVDRRGDVRGRAHEQLRGVLDGKALHTLGLDGHDLRDGAEEVAHDVHRVRAVVDEHTTPADLRHRVPPVGHRDARREGVLEQDDVAEDAGVDDALRADHVVDEPELGRHREDDPVSLGELDEVARARGVDRQRLLAEHGHAPVQEVGADLGMGRGRRADDHGVAARLLAQLHVRLERHRVDATGERAGGVDVDVRDRDELRPLDALEQLDVRPSDAARTDQPDSKRGAHDAPPASLSIDAVIAAPRPSTCSGS